ncbi:MAG TPA: secretin and TonB N-terminal domain-containing protein [Candidatus Tripitaka californicus]|uniref:secretin and TonB N-terminal domain-containing protein n=1 Tax=Candidatus Tripitaka californicus TaxID=3367616 RepID=UPI004027BCBD
MSIVGRSVLSGKALPVAVFFLAIVVVGCVPAAKKLPTDSVTSPSLTDLPKEKRLEELPVLQLEEKVKKPESPRVYSIFVRDADIRDVLQGFSKESKVNIIVDPDVSGKVTIDLEDVTMAQAMDALLTPMGLEYRVDSGFIRVSKPKAITRIFRLNYILTKRKGERNLSTSVGSAAGGGAGGAGLAAGKSEVKGEDTQDIFQEIEISLIAIGLKSAGMAGAQGGGGAGASISIITTLPPGVKGLFSINRQAGIILVTAFPEVIAKVGELLEAVEGTIQRQVLIQTKIVEVSLNNEFRYSINYDMLFGSRSTTGNRRPPAASFGQGMDTAARELLPNIARDISSVAGFFQFTLRTGDIEPIVEALSIQGDVNVISSPKVSTLNNQTAIIRVGQQKTFFSVSTTTQSAGTGLITSSTVDENTITVGVTLDVTPQISQDGFITMNIHPSVTEQVGETRVNTPTASATAPILDVRETDTVIRVKDGETIAIGGLMQDKKNLNENQVPILGKIPGLSFLFKEVNNKKTKVDLVIFLTPTILVGERVEDLSTEDIQRLKLTERR